MRVAQNLSQPAPSAGMTHARLVIDKPRSEHEQEAERVSERVLRMPEPQRQRVPTGPAHSSDAGHTATPPMVRDVLRSPGQSLEPTARDFMEQRFGHDFGRIRIHADPPAQRASAMLGAEAFTVGHHIAFARERFRPDTRDGRRLVAHELTHAVQQVTTSPYVARTPTKDAPAPARVPSKFDGALLGTDRNDRQVLVGREVGGTRGFDDRLQATAVARLAKAEPSAVARTHDGKWHAFETTRGIIAADAGARDPKASIKPVDAHFKVVEFLPSRLAIDQARRKVDEFRATLASIDKLQKDWKTKGSDTPVPGALEHNREIVNRELNNATQSYAALVLGVPESEVLQITGLPGRVVGKINIIPPQGKNKPQGGHSPIGGETKFKENLPSAIHLDLAVLDEPVRAQSTLFHEAQHLHDWRLAQLWVERYRTEAGGMFVKSAPDPFKAWLQSQVRLRRLTAAEGEVVFMNALDANAYTEARANVRTFLAALEAGAADEATTVLGAYANALKPKDEGGTGEYANPAPGSEVQTGLVAELKVAYARMPKPMKQQYDDAVAAARKKYPGAWISELDFAKGARK